MGPIKPQTILFAQMNPLELGFTLGVSFNPLSYLLELLFILILTWTSVNPTPSRTPTLTSLYQASPTLDRMANLGHLAPGQLGPPVTLHDTGHNIVTQLVDWPT